MRKLFLLFTASLVFANSDNVRADDKMPPIGFFAGSYRVAGVDPHTQMAYQGLCEIIPHAEGSYIMRRTINGRAVEARFGIEDYENYEGTKWKVFVARYNVAGTKSVITYTWNMANLFVGDNYGLLVGTIARYEKGGSKRTILRGFETLIPTTESAKSFRHKLKKEIEELRKEGLENVDQALERAVRVFNATSPHRGEQRSADRPATAPESNPEDNENLKPESEVRSQ